MYIQMFPDSCCDVIEFDLHFIGKYFIVELVAWWLEFKNVK